MKEYREKAVKTEALGGRRAHDSRLGTPVARSLHLLVLSGHFQECPS